MSQKSHWISFWISRITFQHQGLWISLRTLWVITAFHQSKTNFSLEYQIAGGIRESQQWPSLCPHLCQRKFTWGKKDFPLSPRAERWRVSTVLTSEAFPVKKRKPVDDTGTMWIRERKAEVFALLLLLPGLGYGCCPEHAWPSVCLHLSLWICSAGCQPPPPMSEMPRHVDSIHFNITFLIGFIRAGH